MLILGIFSPDAVFSTNNNTSSVQSRTCKKRKKCNDYHHRYNNNNYNEVMALCQLKTTSKCLSCKGDKNFGGFFCSRNDCGNFVGSIISRLYRRLFKDLELFWINKNEDDETVLFNEHAEGHGIGRVCKKIKRLKHLMVVIAVKKCYPK